MIKQKLFLCIISTILLFNQCAKKSPQLTIAIGGAPNEIDYWETILNEFQQKTSIPVKLLRQPTDTDQRRQNLVIPLKAKEPDPDIFLMDVAWVGQFAHSDWLLPLNSFIDMDKFDLKNFFASVLEQIDHYHNTIIALPVYIDSGLLYYRKDLLNKYKLSVPTTWEELIQTALKVQTEERKSNLQLYGYVWQGAQYEGLTCNFMEFLTSNKGKLIDASGKSTIMDNKNIQALQLMTDLIHRYKISPPNTYTEMKEEEVRTYFENGNALYERNWPYAAKLHESDSSPIKSKWGMTILPKFNNGQHASTLGGWHLGISKFSDKQNEAWELLKFITSYEIQKKFALNLGWNPGRQDIYSDGQIKKEIPNMAVLKQAFTYSVARPVVPYYTQFSEILQKYVNMALAGTKDPKQALEEANTEIIKIINLYNE